MSVAHNIEELVQRDEKLAKYYVNFLSPEVLQHLYKFIKNSKPQWSNGTFYNLFHLESNELRKEIDSHICNEDLLNFLIIENSLDHLDPAKCGIQYNVLRLDAYSEFDWHSDIDPKIKRLIGFSINISKEKISGGAFLIRDKSNKSQIERIENLTPGGMHTFQIDPSFQHKVEKIEVDSIPRISISGWLVLK